MRTAGADGRISAVRLTEAGRRLAGRIADARAGVLVDALAALSDRERADLDGAVDTILMG